MIKFFLIVLGVVVINFLIVLILLGSYSMIDGLIQDITGISISDRIQDYFLNRRRR